MVEGKKGKSGGIWEDLP